MNDAAIILDNVTFQYRAQSEPTLKQVSLRIERGQRVAIVGQSGSGKSTLAHLINGLIPHRYPGMITGSVQVGGLDPTVTSLAQVSKIVGTVLQDADAQFIGLTVAEDIAFAMENDCVDQSQMHQRVSRVSELVGIEQRLGAAPQDLSGGQKQRVSMAGVLVDEVEILLFDEPLASLDPATGRSAVETIAQIHQRSNVTVVVIEHRLEDVLALGLDRIIVMADGRVVADDTPDAVLASGVLTAQGIREPLYLTATRLAGQTVSTADRPALLRTLRLSAGAAAELTRWGMQPRSTKADAPSILELSDLHFAINDTPIIRGVGAQIRRGEMVALCGTNGAGKSTLAKLICGFERPDRGRICLRGEDVTTAPIARRGRHVGFVLQNPNQMISQPLIADEVALALRDRDLTEAQRQHRCEEALRICGLWQYRSWPVSALSYGQRKRVTIASVMVMSPEVLILDEPTAGQDWAHYTEIMEFLRRLREGGTTVIVVTHDMHLALEYTSRALVMSAGQIIADVPSAQLLSDPELTAAASLRPTSLYDLALRVGVADPVAFTQQFISRERDWRGSVLSSAVSGRRCGNG